MKNYQLFELQQGLATLGNLKGVKFAYAININRKRIEKEIKRLTDSVTPHEEYEPFAKIQQELHTEMCIKDDNGKPKTFLEGGRVITKINPEDEKEFHERLAPHQVEHKEAIKAREDQIAEYNELLQEEVAEDLEFHKIKLENVSEDITDAQMSVIMDFIEE